MKKRIEAAIQELLRKGYIAEKSNIGGFIRVFDPYVIRSGGCPVRTGADVVQVHHTKVFEFIDARS